MGCLRVTAALEARPPVPIALFSQHVAKLREDGCIKFSEDYAVSTNGKNSTRCCH